ncbi:MAG: hypothetical protein U9Q07_04210 [Planctomycetota bacterium]|nr:hypothetical protein [Planctomycetota bacterium]
MTSSIMVNVARDVSSILHPLTGTRATGKATIKATGADYDLAVGSYLVPVHVNEYRDDLVFKVDIGANADRSWTITSAGTVVDITANLGGARFNLADATPLYLDPGVDEIASAVVTGAIITGVNPSSLGLQDVQLFEQFNPPTDGLDMARSSLKQFPAALMAWGASEPADGSAVSQTSQGGRAGRGKSLYHEIFDLYIFTNNMVSDHIRRQDGLRLMDAATMLLTSTRASDGVAISSPSGIQVRRRWRHNLANRDGFQRYYAYVQELAVMTGWTRTDTRFYSDLTKFLMSIIKPQIPALPDQGDFPVVTDVEITNP